MNKTSLALGNTRLDASVLTRIDRKDFGMLRNSNRDGGGVVVGDYVEIPLDVELILKK
jgi:hypothetical protein